MGTAATCSECGGRVVLSPQMEPVCTACGLVQLAEDGSRWASGKALTHSSPPRRLGGLHAGTLIGFERGMGGLNGVKLSLNPSLRARFLRLRYLHQMQPRMGRVEGIIEGERVLLRTCVQLGLSNLVVQRALYLYRRVVSVFSARGGMNVAKPALAAACIVIALTSGSQGGVVTSKKVIEVFRSMGHRVSFNSLSRAVVQVRKALGLRMSSRDPHSYLPSIVEEALSRRSGVDDRVKAAVLRLAGELLNMVSKKEAMGKAPRILAAAAVYAASKIIGAWGGEKKSLVTQRILSQVVGVAEFSIRLHYCKIFKPLLGGVHSWSKQGK